jgi:hypothetical protein
MYGRASYIVGLGCVLGILFYLFGETVIDRITHVKKGDMEISLENKNIGE